MDDERVTDREEDIPGLLRLDPRSGCGLCRTGPAAAATVGALCRWWLNAGRERWRVRTFLAYRTAPQKLGITFKFSLADRALPLPVFLALFQHWKNHPHYQLYVPTPDLRVSREDRHLRERIEQLKRRCASSVDRLRCEGRQAISLHEPLPAGDVAAITDAVAELVHSLRGLSWGGGA